MFFFVFKEEEFIFKCLYFEICVIFKHANIVNKKKLYDNFVITKKKGEDLKIHIIINKLRIFYHKFKNEQKNDNFRSKIKNLFNNHRVVYKW